MAVKHHEGDGDKGPILIYFDNHWEFFISSGILPSHIGLTRRARQDNNSNSKLHVTLTVTFNRF